MNHSLCLLRKWCVLVVGVLPAIFFAGCESTGSAARKTVDPGIAISEQRLRFRGGDRISIEFSDVGGMPQQWQQVIREDGTITLPMNQTVMAADTTKGELEEAIRKLYVPQFFRRITVNVKPEDRWYWVRGEVRNPTQLKYTGEVRVMQAIAAAGDFTDFANRKKIQVVRADGSSKVINGIKALNDSELDVPIYPGDTIVVHRRF
jgi:protein involved in polysaccharide export with SLBB domain